MTVEPSQVSPHVLRFVPTLDGFADANARIKQLLDVHEVGGTLRFNTELVFEELAVNIIRYASASDIVTTVDIASDAVTLTLEDNGVAFDPRHHVAGKRPGTLDEAQVGGLGVMLVKKATDVMSYERTVDHLNRIRVRVRSTSPLNQD